MNRNRRIQEGEAEAELERIARTVGRVAAEAELPLPQRIARAEAGLRRAQAREARARRMMRPRPNQALRLLNDALARQERIGRLLARLRGSTPYR